MTSRSESTVQRVDSPTVAALAGVKLI